jgi:hypothetical protein
VVTTGESRYAEPAERYLSLAADRAVADLQRSGVGLYAGLAGVAWVEALVARLKGGTPLASDDVDELLIELLARPWRGPWDLTAGLVGLGVYALERTATKPALLQAVLERLGQVSESRGEWIVDTAELFGQDGGARPAHYVDVSVAHGVAGVVAFSALAVGAGVDAARSVLTAATGELLAHRRPSGSNVFPAIAEDQRDEPLPPRWCYGDLGVAGALTVAAPLLSHPLVGQSRSLVVDRLQRAPSAAVTDLGLCHGVAGAAHVLHRVAAATGSDRAWDSAGRWGRLLLQRLDDGHAGHGPGWLEGDAGVALTLLAQATDVPPLWDRALLLA